jgi:hypothetical protein
MPNIANESCYNGIQALAHLGAIQMIENKVISYIK